MREEPVFGCACICVWVRLAYTAQLGSLLTHTDTHTQANETGCDLRADVATKLVYPGLIQRNQSAASLLSKIYLTEESIVRDI